MLELVKLDSATLPGIADAIRAKTGETALLLPSQMAGAIGEIKNLRVKTGTITPAEDTVSLTLPEPYDGVKALVVSAVNQTELETKGADSIYSFRAIIAYATNKTTDITGTLIRYTGSVYSAASSAFIADGNGKLYIVGSPGRYFRAGIVYRYYVYYWEDDA